MPMQTYTTRVAPGGKGHTTVEVRVQANGPTDARRLLEAQYGKENIRGGIYRA